MKVPCVRAISSLSYLLKCPDASLMIATACLPAFVCRIAILTSSPLCCLASALSIGTASSPILAQRSCRKGHHRGVSKSLFSHHCMNCARVRFLSLLAFLAAASAHCAGPPSSPDLRASPARFAHSSISGSAPMVSSCPAVGVVTSVGCRSFALLSGISALGWGRWSVATAFGDSVLPGC
jgi:hypothetical protein